MLTMLNNKSSGYVINKNIPPKNIISFNFLGNGALFGLYYDRCFTISNHAFISTKIGAGVNEISNGALCYTIPHQTTINFGSKSHFLEMGIGALKVLGKNQIPYLIYPTLGYRLQPLKKKGIYLRFYSSILLNNNRSDYGIFTATGKIFFSPIGLSIGLVHF